MEPEYLNSSLIKSLGQKKLFLVDKTVIALYNPGATALKTVEVWKKFSPFISESTKEIILNGTSLLEEAAKTECQVLAKSYVKIRSL